MNYFLLVFLGGGFGSICRYAISMALNTTNWPTGTWLVNLVGSFLIGLIFPLAEDNRLRVLLISGFMGGFTTYSSFSFEFYTALASGQTSRALLYALSTLVLGLAACATGIWIAKTVF